MRDTLEKVIDYAKKNGATSADAILNTGKSFSVSAQKEQIDKYQVSGSQIVGVRVIKDDKVGISYTEAFDDEALELAAKHAVDNASF